MKQRRSACVRVLDLIFGLTAPKLPVARRTAEHPFTVAASSQQWRAAVYQQAMKRRGQPRPVKQHRVAASSQQWRATMHQKAMNGCGQPRPVKQYY